VGVGYYALAAWITLNLCVLELFSTLHAPSLISLDLDFSHPQFECLKWCLQRYLSQNHQYYKMPLYRQGIPTLAMGILWPISTVVLGDLTKPPITAMALSSNGLGWHQSIAHCYCDHMVVVTSHHGCHMSPLLLRATTVMAIRVISLEAVAIKRVTTATSRLVPPRSQKVALAYISTCLHHVHWGGVFHG
jgi:hypothetical protein